MLEMRFGALGFGDGIEAASFLGRPDTFEWTQDKSCELLYAGGGFQLDLDDGKFAYAAFFIGPDSHQPKHPALKFSMPRLNGLIHAGIGLSPDTKLELLFQLLGSPEKADSDAPETVLHYTRQGIAMEFEMDGATGRLKRWNLYPE